MAGETDYWEVCSGPPEHYTHDASPEEDGYDPQALEVLAELITGNTAVLQLPRAGTEQSAAVPLLYKVIYHDNGN